jgi:hypothetical protein
MPQMMQPRMRFRTKRARQTKGRECVHVGPIRMYFSPLIGFDTDKAKVVEVPKANQPLQLTGAALRFLATTCFTSGPGR